MPKIAEYARVANGGRRRSFEVDGFTVMIEPHENDRAAAALAETLADAIPSMLVMRAEINTLRAKMPPERPVQLLGPGCVRMRNGELWLLNRRDQGWASWGVRCAGWDDLFRRFNVVVTEHGDDEHGPYWTVHNAKQEG